MTIAENDWSKPGAKGITFVMNAANGTGRIDQEARWLRRRSLWKAVIFGLSVVALIALLRITPLSEILQPEWWTITSNASGCGEP